MSIYSMNKNIFFVRAQVLSLRGKLLNLQHTHSNTIHSDTNHSNTIRSDTIPSATY